MRCKFARKSNLEYAFISRFRFERFVLEIAFAQKLEYEPFDSIVIADLLHAKSSIVRIVVSLKKKHMFSNRRNRIYFRRFTSDIRGQGGSGTTIFCFLFLCKRTAASFRKRLGGRLVVGTKRRTFDRIIKYTRENPREKYNENNEESSAPGTACRRRECLNIIINYDYFVLPGETGAP